jgi:alkylation response protein AidB-like acyl-CoA dehydrogenase
MSDLDQFRSEIRAWIEANCPPEMRTPARGDDDVCWGGRNFVFQSEAQKQWLERCAEKGLTVPDWPKAYGGAGLSAAETKIFRQEIARAGARSPLKFELAAARVGRSAAAVFRPNGSSTNGVAVGLGLPPIAQE